LKHKQAEQWIRKPLLGSGTTLKDLCLHRSTKIPVGGRVRTLKKLKGIVSSSDDVSLLGGRPGHTNTGFTGSCGGVTGH